MDSLISKIIKLISELEITDFQKAEQLFADKGEVELGHEWKVIFDEGAKGWLLIPSGSTLEDVKKRKNVITLPVCVIKGCENYTYGGVVCVDHPPWKDFSVNPDDSNSSSGGSVLALMAPDVGLTESDRSLELSPILPALVEGVMTKTVVNLVLDSMFEERKSEFGAEESAAYRHHYLLNSAWGWSYWSQPYQVMVDKEYFHSRSFRFQTVDGRFVFHTCAHLPYCRNIGVFFIGRKKVHRYCVEHKDEALGSIRFTTAEAIKKKRAAIERISFLVNQGTQNLTNDSKWSNFFSFLYRRGEHGQVVRVGSYEIMIKVSVDGRMLMENYGTGGTNAVCIARRFGCLRSLLVKCEGGNSRFYCSGCSSKHGKFVPESVIGGLEYGCDKNRFFKYW